MSSRLHTSQEVFWPAPFYKTSKSFRFLHFHVASPCLSSLLRLSKELMSEDWPGHSTILIFLFFSYFFVVLVIRFGTLSSIYYSSLMFLPKKRGLGYLVPSTGPLVKSSCTLRKKQNKKKAPKDECFHLCV